MSFFKNLFFHSKKHEPDPPANPEPASAPTVSSQPDVQLQVSSSQDLAAETAASELKPEPEAPPAPPKIHPVAWQVADCIESEFASPELSVQGFAQALNMNPTYLCRIFRSSYQMSINDYINQTRIRHSLDYLEETNIPVEEIARMVGFQNTKYFFVLFKNVMGMTPRQYRVSRRLNPSQ